MDGGGNMKDAGQKQCTHAYLGHLTKFKTKSMLSNFKYVKSVTSINASNGFRKSVKLQTFERCLTWRLSYTLHQGRYVPT